MTILRKLLAWPKGRGGNVLVLSAASMIGTFAFTALTVDIGYIALTKTQMQAASDAAALAAGLKLRQGWGPGRRPAPHQVAADARQAAREVAAEHEAGDWDSVYINPNRDVRFGQAHWNKDSQQWEKLWGVAPYNMVEVTVRRVASGEEGSGGDEPLPLFFGPILDQDHAEIRVRATAALIPGVGVRIDPGSTRKAEVLPITLHETLWQEMQLGVGDDEYAYNRNTEQVNNGSDGILEIDLYPQGHGGGGGNNSSGVTPGNYGTVDFGDHNNSTNDLRRQIREGLNEDDLSAHGGEVRTDDGPVDLNGDTGLSNGIKDSLESVIGKSRAIPLFKNVAGAGNNATFTITQFVGVRILEVDLTGKSKQVVIQAAPFSDSTVIGSKKRANSKHLGQNGTFFSPIKLID